MAPIDSRILRSGLGCFATGIAIVTTCTAKNDPVGVTVNSFSSVSLDPPLILFSLLRSANVLSSFQQADCFAINILGHGQQELSNMFARPSTADWNGVVFSEAANGCALLSNSLAQLECTKVSELEGGDHLIFLGEVTRIHLHVDSDPLLFYRGAYGTYARNQWSKLPPPDTSLADFAITSWG